MNRLGGTRDLLVNVQILIKKLKQLRMVFFSFVCGLY